MQMNRGQQRSLASQVQVDEIPEPSFQEIHVKNAQMEIEKYNQFNNQGYIDNYEIQNSIESQHQNL